MNRRAFLAAPLALLPCLERRYVVVRPGYRLMTKDEERMFRYWYADIIEKIALTPKAPYFL